MAKRPGSSVLAVLVLAMGMAAAATVATAIHGVLLAPLPFPHAERLVALWDEQPALGITRSGPTPANMLDWRARNRSFEGVAAYYAGEPRSLDTPEGVEKLAVAEVTTDFFAVLGRQPRLGRFFSAGEVAGEAAVTVLSHGLWLRRFGGDASVLGRSVSIDGAAHRVIGVMPPDFAVPDGDTALWLPWDFARAYARLGHVPRDFRFLRVLARLTPGTELAAAQADMDRLAAELDAEHAVNRGWRVRVVPLKDEWVGALEAPLAALGGAALFVLLIALINAAHLLLGRLTARHGELAIRRALGASRFQVARLMGLEALLVTSAAGLLGWLGARVLLLGLRDLAPATLPRLEAIRPSASTALLSVAMTAAIATVLVALAAWGVGVAGRRPVAAMSIRAVSSGTGAGREGGRRRWSGGLVALQIAAAFVLMVLALLTVVSLRQLVTVDPGFSPRGVLVARVFPDAAKYDTAAKRLGYFDRLEQRLAALPGVRSVGASSGLPMNAYNNTPSTLFGAADTAVEDGGAEADVFMTTAGYHPAMGMRLVEGRWFDRRDGMDAEPVVIVNQALARTVWGDRAAVGKRLRLRFGRDRDMDFQVVGVVASAHSESLRTAPRAEAFRPHAQVPYVTMNVVVATDLADPLVLADPVRQAILELDSSQPVHSVTTVRALVESTIAPDRFAMTLLVTLALLAVVLAAAGIYGVMAQAVRVRVPEIGLRMALGASPARVVREVMRRAGGLLVAGTVAGLGILLLVRPLAVPFLERLMFGVTLGDGRVHVAAAAVLATAVLLACWLPARRAARVDPTDSLRADAR